MCSEVCIELSADVDCWWLASGILHHQEQLGHYLNDVAGLEHEVSLPGNSLGRQTARDIGGLAAELSSGRRLEEIVENVNCLACLGRNTHGSNMKHSNVIKVRTQR